MAKIPAKIEKLITAQIHKELFSHLSYLAMSAYFERGAYKGFAAYMRKQAADEHTHAMKFFDYLISRNAPAVLSKVDAPATEFRSPLEIFKKALVLEESVTKSIHEIYEAAFELKDFGTLEMLNWFLKEQVEEEEVTTDWIDKLTLAGDDVSALLRLDHEAGKTKE